MHIALYSPYLDTLGGGERYLLTVAEILSHYHQIDILMDSNLQTTDLEELKKNLQERLNLNLDQIKFIPSPIGAGTGQFKRALFLKKYDLLFAVTDGSLFFSTAKKSILHIQTPLNVSPGSSLFGKAKLKSWNLIVYNSEFTKQHSEKNWPIKSVVIYPPVDVVSLWPLEKKKYILSVGRFFGFLREKKHQLMIEVFADLSSEKKLPGWELHLAGSAAEGDMPYLEQLKMTAKGTPVYFHPNISYTDLVKLYGESSIYWHAMGYGETDPTKQEHFGITTVEAMAAGAVPIVVKKGGAIEVIEENKSGLFWQSTPELKDKTISLVEDPVLLQNLSAEAVKRAQDFSKEHFKNEILKLLDA
jgi:glycosyltransferase involved in cell wall biosynthesis